MVAQSLMWVINYLRCSEISNEISTVRSQDVRRLDVRVVDPLLLLAPRIESETLAQVHADLPEVGPAHVLPDLIRMLGSLLDNGLEARLSLLHHDHQIICRISFNSLFLKGVAILDWNNIFVLRESLEYHDLIKSHIVEFLLFRLLNLEGVVLSVLLRFRLVDCTEGSSSD